MPISPLPPPISVGPLVVGAILMVCADDELLPMVTVPVAAPEAMFTVEVVPPIVITPFVVLPILIAWVVAAAALAPTFIVPDPPVPVLGETEAILTWVSVLNELIK